MSVFLRSAGPRRTAAPSFPSTATGTGRMTYGPPVPLNGWRVVDVASSTFHLVILVHVALAATLTVFGGCVPHLAAAAEQKITHPVLIGGTHKRPSPTPTATPAVPVPTLTGAAAVPIPSPSPVPAPTAAPVPAPAPAGSSSGSYQIGVLLADESRMLSDRQAGIRLAVLELRWDQWQPASAMSSAAYRTAIATKAQHYRDAGFSVAIDLGLQHAPSWVTSAPGAQLQAQTGQLSGTANFVFDQRVRSSAEAYLRDVVASVGPLAYVRVGLSASGETLYPEAPDNQWWAFDPMATGARAGRPASIPASPLPGWVPGTPSVNGSPVTAAQAQSWYKWYLGASVDAHAWEIAALRRAGYAGDVQLVMPGNGANPWVYAHRVSSLLAPQSYDAYHTLNTGAVWQEFLQRLPDRRGVVVDVSSVADGSGSSTTRQCQPGDSSVDYRTDSSVGSWSSTRWLTYLAGRVGLPVIGENPGKSSTATMASAFQLMTGCHLRGLQWAWDYQLYDSRYASVTDLAEQVALH